MLCYRVHSNDTTEMDEPDSVNTSVNSAQLNTGIHNIIDVQRYSSLNRLLRVTALVLRGVSRLKNNTAGLRSNEHVSVRELKHAETLWIKSDQQDCYSNELRILTNRTKSRSTLIRQLKLFLDGDGIVRCGGRLQNASIQYSIKHPILLPPKHAYTKLAIMDAHDKVLHSGTATTVTFIRQRLWIPRI